MKEINIEDLQKLLLQGKRLAAKVPLEQVVTWGGRGLAFLILVSVSSLLAKVIEFELLDVPQATKQTQKRQAAKIAKQPLDNYQGILSANLFQSEVGTFSQKKVNLKTKPQGDLKQITNNLVLRGFLLDYAIVLDKKANKEDVYRSSDQLKGSSAKIAQVFSLEGYIKLSLGEETAILRLKDHYIAPASKTSQTKKKGRTAAAASSTAVNQNGSDFYLRSEDIDKELNNFSQLINQARVVPIFKDKKHLGYQIKAIDKGSLYEKLGLKNNDIIKNINGEEINSPERAMSLFKILRNEKEIVLQYERDGKAGSFNYHIQ